MRSGSFKNALDNASSVGGTAGVTTSLRTELGPSGRQLGYTAYQASRFSGCTTAQLDVWRRTGLVVPSDLTTDPAAPYSFRDLVAVRMVASLLDAGLPMARVKRAVTELVPRVTTSPSSHW